MAHTRPLTPLHRLGHPNLIVPSVFGARVVPPMAGGKRFVYTNRLACCHSCITFLIVLHGLRGILVNHRDDNQE
ncbi:hypothetical protein BBOMB_1423 [Bifidobacterium bombi DSM 19703]|uniref:Uncharacterized protein n=1 Tax=Bifidobacterium bombi DSM 19703 TaxID=1341695 RepID=A0A086BNP9_9BIFI|nr:hypothetical protein BBOMB_1423 [Bifidobacterium bombi DSM 19703]